jgi:hypothetical protein
MIAEFWNLTFFSSIAIKNINVQFVSFDGYDKINNNNNNKSFIHLRP